MPLKRTLFWWKTATLTTVLVLLAGCRTDTGGVGGATPSPSPTPDEGTLSPEERAELLQLARQTIATYLRDRSIPFYQTDKANLLQPGGVFVTLKKHGQLRGCIGFIESTDPVFETIQRAAVAAATRDPRFAPVTASELAELTLEISLLSPMERVQDVNDIVVGKHGLLIRRGQYYQGLLLPQVAPEQGWDREQFLVGVCRKAGLPPDAWSDPATELYSFTAEVFSEEE